MYYYQIPTVVTSARRGWLWRAIIIQSYVCDCSCGEKNMCDVAYR
jgi:hypothetical protein